jgi:hypothetical protein
MEIKDQKKILREKIWRLLEERGVARSSILLNPKSAINIM